MPLLGDRVQETTTSAGTGSLTLNGAVTGYVTFNSTFNNGDIVWYVIDDGVGNWEIGYGTVGTGTLTRTVFQSSNANALVNFAAGTKRVFCTAPYTYLLPDQTSNSGKILITDGTTSSWTSDYAGLTSANTFTNTQIINAQVGIGGAPSAGRTLSVTKDITGALQSVGVYSGGTTQSDVTTRTDMFRSTASTAAAAFTLLSLRHYTAQQGTFGAGSSVSYQYGFLADSSLTGATAENYGFYSNISSGTGRYNFYAAGTASNYFAGSLGIGSTAGAANLVQISGTLPSSSAISRGANSNGTVPSTSTSQGISYLSNLSTQAASFTLSSLQHFLTLQGTIGAGSTVTNQYGYTADSSLTGATNNYGFYSNIASGTGRYNFYAAGSASNVFNGSVGIGGDASSGYVFEISKALSGNSVGISASIRINPDATVTAGAYGVTTYAINAVGASTPNVWHFNANQGTFSGTAPTNQYGFQATSALTGATNNYGFYSNIASGTGRYNFYAAGSAANYFAGDITVASTNDPAFSVTGGVRIGSSTATGSTRITSGLNWNFSPLSIIRATSNSATVRTLGFMLDGDSLSSTGIGDYNAIWGAYDSAPTTGSTSSALNGAMVYGAYAGHRWYVNGSERMRIDNAGRVGIGGTPSAGRNLELLKALTGNAYSYNLNINYSVQSDVVSEAASVQSYVGTQAAAFTLSNLRHFKAVQTTIGAGSTVTNQAGFWADGTLTGATNNYGFYSNIASGTGRYNFYSAGTADNYFAGKIGIGGIPTTFVSADIQGTYPAGSFTRGFRAAATIPSSVVGNARLFSTEAYTEAASFTLTALTHYLANQQTIGAGSTVTTQYGFSAETTLTGATNNYGFYSNIASGTGRYNFYAAGTAQNVFAGDVLINSTGGLGYTTGSGGAVTQTTSRTTGVTLNKTNGAITLVSAAGSATYQTFTVTNSTVAATDVIHVSQKSGTDKYIILVTAVAAGSFAITFATTGGTTTEQPVFNFAVLKAVAA